MTVDLQHRNLVSLLSLTTTELRYLIALSADLKAAARAGTENPWLNGKRIALVFGLNPPADIVPEFEEAARDQGIRIMPIPQAGSRAYREARLKDATRFLGHTFDAIECRGLGDEFLRELAAQASVPVYGGLSGDSDAVRVLAGLLTMLEHSAKPLRNIACCYVGDGRSGLADSLMIIGTRLGMNVRICAPYSMWPPADLAEAAHRLATENGGRFLLTDDVDQGAFDVDFLYSGVWIPGGRQRPAWGKSAELLSLQHGNTYISPRTQNRPPRSGGEIPLPGTDGLEIIDEIFTSGCSLATAEARNRRHAIKAVLVATLAR